MTEENDIVGDIFGWTGTVISTYFFIAPCVPFYKVVKEEMKYSDSPGLLLIFSFMNCILWACYGLLQDNSQVYVANGIGGTITLIWITIFLIYFAGKKFILAFLLNLAVIALIAGISIVFFYFIGAQITGLVAMVFNVLMYAAPGEKIYRVIKTGKYELIPIFSTVGGLLCSGCWLMFGIYKADMNLIIPNGLGLFFAILQVAVYLVYYCKAKKEDSDFKGESDDVV